MTQDLDDIMVKLLSDKSMPVDADWALSVLKDHPSFSLLAATLLARNADLDESVRGRLQSAVVLGCPDRAAICDYADFSGCDWADFYPAPQPKKQKSTTDTIDKFISTYGGASSKEEEILERLIFNPTPPDYLQGTDTPLDPSDPLALPPELKPGFKPQSEKEQPQTAAAGEETLPKAQPETVMPPPFKGVVKANNEQKTQKEQKNQKPAKNNPENHLLMESLAKIFIKQQRYERALEIISNLSLNYPEKSVYFADQIRFLQKLIINQRRQASKTS